MAAYTVSEHATHGALQLITGLASSAVTGATGLAKTALIGRQDGYRAGEFLVCYQESGRMQLQLL